MKYAIVLPSGSGKTTLSKKYKNLIDIDTLLTETQQDVLKELCIKAMKDNNWFIHQNKEHEFISNKIKMSGINEELFESYLDTANQKNPDLCTAESLYYLDLFHINFR